MAWHPQKTAPVSYTHLMRYDFEFVLGDYTGPMDYYFRVDDDVWLYVDGNLVSDVDLGGIHLSLIHI